MCVTSVEARRLFFLLAVFFPAFSLLLAPLLLKRLFAQVAFLLRPSHFRERETRLSTSTPSIGRPLSLSITTPPPQGLHGEAPALHHPHLSKFFFHLFHSVHPLPSTVPKYPASSAWPCPEDRSLNSDTSPFSLFS